VGDHPDEATMKQRQRTHGLRGAALFGAVLAILLSSLLPACSSSEPDDPKVTLRVTFSPNPAVASADGSWTYTVNVTELAGNGTYINDFTVERFSGADIKYSEKEYNAAKFKVWFDDCGGSGTYIAGGTTRCANIISIEGRNSGHADWTFNGVDVLGTSVTGKGRIDWL
jgi:hypothetical protein